MPREIAVRKGRFVGLRGIASGVSTQTFVNASRSTSVSAFLEVRFRLGGLEIVSRVVGDVFAVADGDEVIVSGYIHSSELLPVAWWNCTKRQGYSPSTWGYRPTMIALILVAALALWLVLMKHAAFIQILVLILPVLVFAGVAYTDYAKRRCADWVSRSLRGEKHE